MATKNLWQHFICILFWIFFNNCSAATMDKSGQLLFHMVKAIVHDAQKERNGQSW